MKAHRKLQPIKALANAGLIPSQELVARRLGVSTKTVETIEARALKKIRKDKALTNLVKEFIAEQRNSSAQATDLLSLLCHKDKFEYALAEVYCTSTDELLDRQLEVIHWWEVHELTVMNGLDEDTEYLLCEIERRQAQIKAVIDAAHA